MVQNSVPRICRTLFVTVTLSKVLVISGLFLVPRIQSNLKGDVVIAVLQKQLPVGGQRVLLQSSGMTRERGHACGRVMTPLSEFHPRFALS